MARNAGNPLAEALDKRIRAMVEEAVQSVVRDEVRTALREEFASLLGSMAGAAPAPTPARRRGPGRGAKAARARTTRVSRTTTGAARARAKAEGDDTTCGVSGCNRPYRSRGYCAAHYQAARKYGWPMPCPKDFVPPPRPARGRPPKTASAASTT